LAATALVRSLAPIRASVIVESGTVPGTVGGIVSSACTSTLAVALTVMSLSISPSVTRADPPVPPSAVARWLIG